MRRLALTSLLLLLAVAVTGCKSNCRQLSEKLCDCQTNTLDKDACLRQASLDESRIPVSPGDDATCAALLKTCDCNLIDTPAGKKKCGLAR